ncbi:MAG: threonine--tRNA ligase [Candidatus Buchananbacteria bacterium]
MKHDLQTIRHSASHVLAQAVLEFFPEAKLAIGPAIDEGFYYDFDLGKETFSPQDLVKIEQKMRQIIKQNQKFERYEVSTKEAIAYIKSKKQPYKLELAKDLEKAGEKALTFYRMLGPDGKHKFVDLCAGPHLDFTKQIGAVKLLKIAGAYWKGDEKNKMLQRIYGTAFTSEAELKAYLDLLEEAKKRDHKKLGQELGLFSFHEAGPGFPFFKPKGMIIWNELLNYWRQVHFQAGYDEIKTPIMLSRKLWEVSGHWENYRENMYETKIDEMEYAIKPMNCPGGMLMYKEDLYSYRDLPLRWGEIGLVHRHELSGVLSGLFRVRTFHQDDAHIYMRPDQIKDEILGVLKLVEKIYSVFGLSYHLELSTRPAKSIGSDQAWQTATDGLKAALDGAGKEYKINEGDGAFYGPKIDIHIKDAIGRTWQCGTIQLDMNLPERFDLTYIDSDGSHKRPVMIHRVIYGSVERFFGILIEHYAGVFPLWLAPVQVQIAPVASTFIADAEKLAESLKDLGIRVFVDDSNETVGYKIRKSEKAKVPYTLVIGEKEAQSNDLSVRLHGQKETQTMTRDEFAEKLVKEIKDKK